MKPGPSGRLAVGLLLVVAALALRLFRLGHEEFWIDEVFQVRVAERPLADIVANYRPGVDYHTLTRDQAPLSHLIAHFFVREGGGEAVARLPSAVAGALAVGVTLAVGARLVAFDVALLAAVLLALSPLDLWYSQECRFYALWKLEATLSYVALIAALESGRLRWWGAYVLATAAGMYTCLLHGFIIVAQGITVLWHGRLSGRARVAVLGFTLAMLAVAVTTLPVSRVVLAETGRSAGTARPVVASALAYTLFAYAAGFSLGPTVRELHELPSPLWVVTHYPSVPLTFAVFLPLGLAGLRRLGVRSAPASVILPWLFVPPVGVFLLSLVSNVVYNVRYAFASLPAFLLVIAVGCRSFAAPSLKRAAVAAVLVCFAWSLAGFYWNDTYDREHVRDALAYVQTAEPGAHRIVVVGQVVRAFDYYARGSPTTLVASCEGAGDPDAPPTLWLAAGRDWEGRAGRCLALLADRYRQVERRQFVGIDLWRLERVGTAR